MKRFFFHVQVYFQALVQMFSSKTDMEYFSLVKFSSVAE